MSSIVASRERTFKCGSVALTEGQIVKFDTDGTVIAATVGGDVSLGIVVRDAAIGDNVSVVLRSAQGTAKVIASAAISRSAKVTATTAGKAVTTTTNKDEVVGVAISAATGANDLIEIMLANYTLSA